MDNFAAMYSPTPADWHEANRAHWDERVPLHVASDFYDLDAFRAGKEIARRSGATDTETLTRWLSSL